MGVDLDHFIYLGLMLCGVDLDRLGKVQICRKSPFLSTFDLGNTPLKKKSLNPIFEKSLISDNLLITPSNRI